MGEFRMPSLGADMDAGTLVRWLKKPGDRLARGEIIAEVETDKGIITVEVFEAGRLERVLVEPGTKVPVGTALAVLSEGAGPTDPATPVEPTGASVVLTAPSPVPAAPQAAHAATPAARRLALERGLEVDALPGSGRHGVVTRGDVERARPEPAAPAPVGSERPRVSPLARRRATELGVDAARATPTGPDGAVVAADVERLAAERPAPPPAALPDPGRRSPSEPPPADAHARMRRAIAASMARSKREIPHYYVSHTFDLEPALAWLRAENERRSVEERLLPGVLLLRAVVLALRKFPDFNAHWRGADAPPLPEVHLGVAVSLRAGGLVAPAILDAHGLSLDELMRAFKDVVGRARSGKLKAAEMSAPTITVTSLGERGVDEVFPVIVPPQVAMIGFGTTAVRPWVADGAVVPRSVVRASLAADHRVTDGHRGSLFLAAIGAHLLQPSTP